MSPYRNAIPRPDVAPRTAWRLRWLWTICDGRGGDAAVWLFGISQLAATMANMFDHIPQRYESTFGVACFALLAGCCIAWCAVFVTRERIS